MTCFVVTKDMFCCDKHVFGATKMILVAAPVIVSVTQDHSSKGTDQKHLINSLQKQHRHVVCTLFKLVLQCFWDSRQTVSLSLSIAESVRGREEVSCIVLKKMAVVALDIFQTSVTSSLQGTFKIIKMASSVVFLQ